jgi:RNase P/RNase MRP subunit p29
MTNEIANVNHEVLAGQVVREEKNYVVIKNEEGKFVRKAKYLEYSSIVAETREDKIWLLNLMEGNEDTGNGLKDHVGKIIEVANIITRPYDKINEETGATEYGVLTYLFTPDKIAYVTSSKNVYFSITNIMDLFGAPDQPEWENIKIKVGKEKGTNGDMIKIKMVG